MIALRELQREFLGAVLGCGDNGNSRNSEHSCGPSHLGVARALKADWIASGDGLNGAQRLQIYRNNSCIAFEEALKSMYPVVHRLGGEDWFAAMAGSYQRAHPSRSGDLHEVGEKLAAFLTAEFAGSGYEYFAEVAQLEWAYQESLVAPDPAAADFQGLEALAVQDVDAVKLVLDPTARAIGSPYPIFAIWKANREQSTEPAPIDLQSGASRVLVIRRETHIEVREMSRPAFELFARLYAGDSLAAALEATTVTAADALAELARLKAFTGFTIGEPHVL